MLRSSHFRPYLKGIITQISILAMVVAMLGVTFTVQTNTVHAGITPGLCTPCGVAGGTLNGVINDYWPGKVSAAAGATTISLNAQQAGGAGNTIAIGDLLLVIQMQDTNVSFANNSGYGTTAVYNSSGLYEYVTATNAIGAAGGIVNIGTALSNSYVNANATGAHGQERFQVVRVPQYGSATVGNAPGLTADPWNGASGGIVALIVCGTLNLGGGTIDVSGQGFRGGAGRVLTSTTTIVDPTNDWVFNSQVAPAGWGGSKGEGDAGTPRYVFFGGAVVNSGVEGYPNGSYGRGAPSIGGGGAEDDNLAGVGNNNNNAGGGGGGSANQGGHGGNGAGPGDVVGGDASHQFNPISPTHVIMGGGGGAGGNNGGAPALLSSGAAGGGIILVQAFNTSGAGTANANGADAQTVTGPAAAGGGGAGGTVLFETGVGGTLAGLTANANGGAGGSTNLAGALPFGPGGGGAGGAIYTTSAPGTHNVNGGNGGITDTTNDAYGSNPGFAGVHSFTAPTVKCGPPVVGKSFSPPSILPGATSTMTITIQNTGTVALTNVSFNDPLPTVPGAMLVASPLNFSTTPSCGAPTFAPTVGAATLAYSGGTIAPGATCTITIDITAAVPGLYTNTINPFTSNEAGPGGPATGMITVLTPTSTATNTATNTATFTATSTSTDTATNTATNTATDTATNTATFTATNTATNTATDTPSNTPSNTATNTATNTPSDTATNTATFTATNTATNTATDTPSNTPSNTATNTATNTPSDTPSNTATSTPSDTPSNTATNTATDTPSNTATNTATDTPSNTVTNTATSTPSDTPTSTDTASVTNTPSNTATNTPTDTPSNTSTPSNTPTSTDTATVTDTPSNTSTSTATNTAAPSTNTPTSTNTVVAPTNTSTSTATSTNTTVPPTSTATSTNTVVLPTNTGTATNTGVPTNTATGTATNTSVGVPTNTATATATSTKAGAPTNTATSTATNTIVPGPSNTATATGTSTIGPVPSNTATSTGSATIAPVPSNTATNVGTPNLNIGDPILAKHSNVSLAQPGSPVGFTLTVTNIGTAPATGVVVTDPIPSPLILQSASATQGTFSINQATNTVVFNVGTVNPGQVITLTVNTIVSPSAKPPIDITNTATLNDNGGHSSVSSAAIHVTAGGLPATGEHPEDTSTPGLWIGALIVVLIGGFVTVRVVRRRRA